MKKQQTKIFSNWGVGAVVIILAAIGLILVLFFTQAQNSGSSYVGLSENEAIEKAESSGVAARVVERDGEPLPATMDFSPGRINLYVENGNVYKISIEGQEAND